VKWLAALALAWLAGPGDAGAAVPCRMDRVAAADGELAYRSCGRGDPVLLVPGGPGLDADYMLGLVQMVVALGYRAVLIEPRGTGRSRGAMGDGAQLTVAGSVADLEALRSALGAARVTLLGHSFGGAVAQAYAAAHPSRVSRLVLLSSAGPDFAPPRPLDGWRARLPAADLAAYDAARKAGDRITAMRIKFRAGFFDSARARAFDAALLDSAIHLDLAPLAEDFRRHFSIRPATRPFPVAIVAGDIDWIRGDEARLAAAYPGASVRTIARAGHFPWIDAPQATRRVLRAALVR
jgi:proline iminopeptidase